MNRRDFVGLLSKGLALSAVPKPVLAGIPKEDKVEPLARFYYSTRAKRGPQKWIDYYNRDQHLDDLSAFVEKAMKWHESEAGHGGYLSLDGSDGVPHVVEALDLPIRQMMAHLKEVLAQQRASLWESRKEAQKDWEDYCMRTLDKDAISAIHYNKSRGWPPMTDEFYKGWLLEHGNNP